MNLKPGCRPKHGVCARFAPSAVRWQELGLGRRGGGGGQGQRLRACVLCGLSEGYQQTMTTGFTCAPDRRARRYTRCSNSTGFLFWWLHGCRGEGGRRVVEGEGRADEVAFDCAGNLLQGAKGGGGTRTRTWQEGAAWGCGSTVSPLLRFKCGPAVTPLVTAAHMTSIMDDHERHGTCWNLAESMGTWSVCSLRMKSCAGDLGSTERKMQPRDGLSAPQRAGTP